jgi:hypothetical protein
MMWQTKQTLATQRSTSVFSWTLPQNRSWHSPVRILSSTVLDNRKTVVRFLARLREFSLLHSIQTGSDSHSTSEAMSAGVLLKQETCRRVDLTTHRHLMWRSRTFRAPASLYDVFTAQCLWSSKATWSLPLSEGEK